MDKEKYNKIINANDLLNLIYSIDPEDVFDCDRISIYKIKELIINLPSTVPEPQESIFDADGWCWDIDKSPQLFRGKFNNGSEVNLCKKMLRSRCNITGREWYPLCVNTDMEYDYPIAWMPIPKPKSE